MLSITSSQPDFVDLQLSSAGDTNRLEPSELPASPNPNGEPPILTTSCLSCLCHLAVIIPIPIHRKFPVNQCAVCVLPTVPVPVPPLRIVYHCAWAWVLVLLQQRAANRSSASTNSSNKISTRNIPSRSPPTLTSFSPPPLRSNILPDTTVSLAHHV